MREEDFFDSDHVVQKVDTEVKRLAGLFRFALKYQEQFQASGIEFSDLRQYQTSDDASRIDWKNSANSQDLFVKEYEEEKDMDVYVVMDASDTMMFGTTDRIKAEYAAVVSAAIVYASIDAGISTGFGMFGESQITLSPDGGQVQYQKILREISQFDNYGGEFNLEEGLNTVIGTVKENTAIFIVSDFLEVAGDWKPKMKVASAKFRHLMNVMVRDPRDNRLPKNGMMRFENMSGTQKKTVSTSKISEKYEEEAEKQRERIKNKVTGAGGSFLHVQTDEKFSASFAKYLDEAEGSW